MKKVLAFLKTYSTGDYISWIACFLAALGICIWLFSIKDSTPSPPTAPTTTPPPGTETISVLIGNDVIEIDILSYLTGVLAVEMGPTFSEEALKAQAVAAYSYALHKISNSPKSHKGNADICNSPGHCQGCITELSYYAKNGESVADQASAKADWEYMKSCANQVIGYQIHYDGKVINAMYHDSSPYYTASFESVFGYDVPYLQSVSSPDLANFEPRKQLYVFSQAELASATSTSWSGQEITLTTSSKTGRVSSISLGSTSLSGVDFRNKTGIRSTCFSISCQKDKVYIYTLGWGHGVGLCQRGAEVMARDGASWQEILTHYYTGVTIVDSQG